MMDLDMLPCRAYFVMDIGFGYFYDDTTANGFCMRNGYIVVGIVVTPKEQSGDVVSHCLA
jgi:hypothetical protein